MDHRGIPAVGADQCAGTPARAEVEGLQKATGSEVLALLQAAVGGKVQLAMHEGDGAVAQHGLRIVDLCGSTFLDEAGRRPDVAAGLREAGERSEEHTSELQ